MTGRLQLIRAAIAAGALTVASLGAVAVAGSASAAQSPDGPKTRIVGGSIAHTADTPWAIQLSNSGSPDPTGEWCGSTLVSTYTAIQGRDVLSDKSTGKESKISKIWVDPEYGKQPGHDVAVMTLATPFDGVPTLALETDKAADKAGAA